MPYPLQHALTRIVVACVIACALPITVHAEDLPPMQWVKLPDAPGRAGGVRQNAAVAWMPAEKRFLIAGGLFPNPGRDIVAIGTPFEMQTFAPSDTTWRNFIPTDKVGKWGEEAGPSKAPKFDGTRLYFGSKDLEGNVRLKGTWPAAQSTAFDAVHGKMYVVAESTLMIFDVASRQWSVKPLPSKTIDVPIYPARADGGSPGNSKEPPVVVASGIIVDPTTNTLYQLGGRCIGAPEGTIGDWALSLESMMWRRVGAKQASPEIKGAHRAAALSRDAANALRNLFYAGTAGGTYKTAQARLADKAAAATSAAGALTHHLSNTGKLHGFSNEGFQRADQAYGDLRSARDAISGGELNSVALTKFNSAARTLEEVASMLDPVPTPRSSPSIAYDPTTGSIILFGGDRGDAVLNDTWLLHPNGTWSQYLPQIAPPPRTGATLTYAPDRKKLILIGGSTIGNKFLIQRRDNRATEDVWEFDPSSGAWDCLGVAPLPKPTTPGEDQSWSVGSTVSIGEGDVALALAHRRIKYTTDINIDAATLLLKLGPPDDAATKRFGVPAGTRAYLSNIKQYDPSWYDGAEPGKPEEVERFLKALKPNEWTEVPMPERTPPPGCWSTAAYNPDLDQIYYWTGGHESDCSSMVHIYHPAINRWSVGYVPEFFIGADTNKGITFQGRPDSNNHTYLNYAFDPISKMMVACSTGGVSLYDPEKRDWVRRSVPPFGFDLYLNKALATPRGVLFWVPSMGDTSNSFFGLYEVATDKYLPLPNVVKKQGEPEKPEPQTDGTAWNYDSKRDVVWIATYDGYQKPNGQIWRYDLKTNDLKPMNPAGQKTIGMCKGMIDTIRETAYLPEADVLLFNNFESDNREVAYDPASNAWITMPIVRPEKMDKQAIGGVGSGWAYDAKRKVIWAIGQYNHVYVLRVDPQTVKR